MNDTRPQVAWVLLALCIAGLGVGLYLLFQARYERGDVYPPYSSLRADPLGTMAFFESLDALPGIRATRDFTPFGRLPEARDTTYLHVAGSAAQLQLLPRDAIDDVERFTRSGGRLVIMLHPRSAPGSWSEIWEESRTNLNRRTPRDSVPFLSGRWGITFTNLPLARTADGAYEPVAVTNKSNLPLPESILWHSGIVCSASNDWITIYSRGDKAVVVERKFGRGSVVIATDSFFVSNEALLLDRHPALLAWLIGPARTVVFDEAHLGVTESPGVVALMRRYRLEGVMAALALLAGLFVWKNAYSLVPRRGSVAVSNEILAGKDAAGGFVNLLRRFIPRNELLATCHAEWSASIAGERSVAPHRVRQVNDLLRAHESSGEKDPVQTYRLMSQALQTGNPESDAANQTS